MNISSLKGVPLYMRAYRNWPSVLWAILQNRETTAVLADGQTLKVDPYLARAIPGYLHIYHELPAIPQDYTPATTYTEAFLQLTGWKLSDHAYHPKFGVKFTRYYEYSHLGAMPALNLAIHETWNMEQYLHEYRGRSVIDVGANIGDTTLYFVKHGAKVHAIEPVQHLVNILARNLTLNDVGGVSVTVAPVCYRDRILVESIVNADVSGGYRPGKSGKPVNCVKLADYPEHDVLKMDCEGCEWEVLRAGEHNLFNTVVMEIHGPLKKAIAMMKEFRLVKLRRSGKYHVAIFEKRSSIS